MRWVILTVVLLAISALLLVRYQQHSGGWLNQAEDEMRDAAPASTATVPRLAAAVATRYAERLAQSSEPALQEASVDSGHAVLDEESLMERIRDNLTRDPRLAETLAREGRERFGDSPASDERDMQLVLALFNQQNMYLAHREAYYYVLRHPNGRFIKDLAPLVGTIGPRR